MGRDNHNKEVRLMNRLPNYVQRAMRDIARYTNQEKDDSTLIEVAKRCYDLALQAEGRAKTRQLLNPIKET